MNNYTFCDIHNIYYNVDSCPLCTAMEGLLKLKKEKEKAIDIAKMFYGEISEYADNDEGDYAQRNIDKAYKDLKEME